MDANSIVVQLLLVSLGGAIGAVLRFAASLLSIYLLGDKFPWGTLGVNLVGCLLLGILFAASQRDLHPHWKMLVGVGLLGALTTFSAFSLDSFLLIRDQRWIAAFNYAAASLLLGVVCVTVGNWLGESWLGPASINIPRG